MFSTLDDISVYWQFVTIDEDKDGPALTSYCGYYRFTRKPSRLCRILTTVQITNKKVYLALKKNFYFFILAFQLYLTKCRSTHRLWSHDTSPFKQLSWHTQLIEVRTTHKQNCLLDTWSLLTSLESRCSCNRRYPWTSTTHTLYKTIDYLQHMQHLPNVRVLLRTNFWPAQLSLEELSSCKLYSTLQQKASCRGSNQEHPYWQPSLHHSNPIDKNHLTRMRPVSELSVHAYKSCWVILSL